MKKHLVIAKELEKRLKKHGGWWRLLGYHIKSNARLEKLKELSAPAILIKYEQEFLGRIEQEIREIVDIFVHYLYEEAKASSIKDESSLPWEYYAKTAAKLFGGLSPVRGVSNEKGEKDEM